MLSSGQAQPEFFTEAALSAVHNASGEGKRTFLEVFDNEARHQALLSGRRYSAGSCLSAIDGLPVSVKGLFDVAGSTTTAASCLLKNASVATDDAHIINPAAQKCRRGYCRQDQHDGVCVYRAGCQPTLRNTRQPLAS
nr:amidase family protein [Pantoea stewartii]